MISLKVKVILMIKQGHNDNNKTSEKNEINEDIIDINIRKDLEELDNSVHNDDNNNNNESQNLNDIDKKELLIDKGKDKDKIIELTNNIDNLNKQIFDIKKELNEEIKDYKTQLNEEKSMNFVLQKKIKDLNMKLQMKTLDEITKNGKININNNINNINIKLKTENNNIQYNKDDLIYNKFAYKKNKIQENDKLVETINILKAENLSLNKKLSFYSSKNNFIGVSFISENNETEEDKCFEEILDELDKNENQISKFI